MARSVPSYHKDEMADNFSECTLPNDNTLYNIELNKLRSQIPDAQATRPRSMEYGYNPRYDSINNAPSGSSRALKRVERAYATMCCGSCCGLFAWIIGSLILITAFVVLLVKVLHPLTSGTPAPNSISAAIVSEKTSTVTQSTVSIPVSTITTSLMSTHTSTVVSISTLTSISVTIQTYTPPSPSIVVVTSEGPETTVISTTLTTSIAPTPTSILTQTEMHTETETETTTTPTTYTSVPDASTVTSLTVSTTTTEGDPSSKDDGDEPSFSWPAAENLRALESKMMSLENKENVEASTWDRCTEHPENVWANSLAITIREVSEWCATRSKDFDNNKQFSSYCEAIPAYEFIPVIYTRPDNCKRFAATPKTTSWNPSNSEKPPAQPAETTLALPLPTSLARASQTHQSLTSISDYSSTGPRTSASKTTPLSVLRFRITSHTAAMGQSPTGAISASIYSEYTVLESKYNQVSSWCQSHSAEIWADASVSEICFDTWEPATRKPTVTSTPRRSSTRAGQLSSAAGGEATTDGQQVVSRMLNYRDISTTGTPRDAEPDRVKFTASTQRSVYPTDQYVDQSEKVDPNTKSYPAVFPVTEKGHNYAFVTSMYSSAVAYMISHSTDQKLYKSASADMVSYSDQLTNIDHWCRTAFTWDADPAVSTYCSGIPESELHPRQQGFLQAPTTLSGSPHFLQPPSFYASVPSASTSKAAADSNTDNTRSSVETTTETTSITPSNTGSLTSFPYIHNVAWVERKLRWDQSYTSHFATNPIIVAGPADDATTLGSLLTAMGKWCSTHNTKGAPEEVDSYCNPAGDEMVRRTAIPVTTTPGISDKETTLITKTISITKIIDYTTASSSNDPDPSSPLPINKDFDKAPEQPQVVPRDDPPQTGTFTTFMGAVDGVKQPTLAQFALVAVGILSGVVLGILMWHYCCPFCCGCIRATGAAAHDWKRPNSERISPLD